MLYWSNKLVIDAIATAARNRAESVIGEDAEHGDVHGRNLVAAGDQQRRKRGDDRCQELVVSAEIGQNSGAQSQQCGRSAARSAECLHPTVRRARRRGVVVHPRRQAQFHRRHDRWRSY